MRCRSLVPIIIALAGCQCPNAGDQPKPAATSATGARSIEITLVHTDHQNLSCRCDESFGGLHCAYKADGSAWGSDTAAHRDAKILQPITTVDREKLLVAGLWQDPNLAAQLSKKSGKRWQTQFIASCNFMPAGTATKLEMQWKRGEKWHAGKDIPAGSVSNCTTRARR